MHWVKRIGKNQPGVPIADDNDDVTTSANSDDVTASSITIDLSFHSYGRLYIFNDTRDAEPPEDEMPEREPTRFHRLLMTGEIRLESGREEWSHHTEHELTY